MIEPLLDIREVTIFRAEVLTGLSRQPKTLPCRWLYDKQGSILFDAITMLEEYYPTRIELSILEENLDSIVDFMGRHVPIVEYGAGSGIKSELLLNAVEPVKYIPIDISQTSLDETAIRFERYFPNIEIFPVVDDFMNISKFFNKTDFYGNIFFPGSTIGNLDDEEIDILFLNMRQLIGPLGRAVIGFDLKKSLGVLIEAYDDKQGITADFNINILSRINRELQGAFRIDQFRHCARWNEEMSAVEMHLVSLADQIVRVSGTDFHFAEGETIHTETSRKFSLPQIEAIAARNGWHMSKSWLDPKGWFAVVGIEAKR